MRVLLLLTEAPKKKNIYKKNQKTKRQERQKCYKRANKCINYKKRVHVAQFSEIAPYFLSLDFRFGGEDMFWYISFYKADKIYMNGHLIFVDTFLLVGLIELVLFL